MLILCVCFSKINAQEKSFTLDEVKHADKGQVLKDVGNIAKDTLKQSNRKIKPVGKSGKQLSKAAITAADSINKIKNKTKAGTLTSDDLSLKGAKKIKLSKHLGKSGKKIDKLVNTTPDSISKIGNKVEKLKKLSEGDVSANTIKKIYSEKHIKFAYDSLLGNLDWNTINSMAQNPASLNDKDLMSAIFLKFPALQKVSKTQQDATALTSLANTGDPLRGVASLAALHIPNLSSKTLPDSLLNQLPDSVLTQLPRLSGGQLKGNYFQLKEKYLNWLDSIRKTNLKKDGYKLTEEKLSKNAKVTKLAKKAKFLDKVYFEGIIGILSGALNGKMNIVQVSPSFGYHLTEFFSLGLGPNILLQEADQKLNLQLGVRTFAKFEFFDKKLYSQVEDQISFPQLTQKNLENRSTGAQHTILAGGGYLLPLTSKLFLNLSVMYRMAGVNNGSPWIFRVGFSSKKTKR